jgi:hypothetical protein
VEGDSVTPNGHKGEYEIPIVVMPLTDIDASEGLPREQANVPEVTHNLVLLPLTDIDASQKGHCAKAGAPDTDVSSTPEQKQV